MYFELYPILASIWLSTNCYPEVGKVTTKRNDDEALSNESLEQSKCDEALIDNSL